MKKVLITFLAVILLQINTVAVYATSEYQLLEPLPGFEEADSTKFVDYIVALYSLAIWIAGFCAMTVLVVAGFIYVTSAGNPSQTGKAKDWIVNALVGLMVVFFAWMILNVINPDLTKIDANIEEFIHMSNQSSNGDDDNNINFPHPGGDDMELDTPGEYCGVKPYHETTKSRWTCEGGPPGIFHRGNLPDADKFCQSKGYERANTTPVDVECKTGHLVKYADSCGDPMKAECASL